MFFDMNCRRKWPDFRSGGAGLPLWGMGSGVSAPLSGSLQFDISHADHVVGGGGQREDPPHSLTAPVLELLKRAHRLQPAEDLFDSLACALTDAVANMP